mmetsp:Transcript_23297/g.43807  ORF Transcript_23297/g.43807 Transcript_23297/m.43807 type:complete len:261 (-) Transcript_23297:90-872(-)
MASPKYPLNDAVRGTSYLGLSLEETFSQIYATNAWGKGSGAGSLPAHCLRWIEFVRKFIKEHHVKSVVDLGCGDWQFSPYIYHDLGVEYVGYDVVPQVIEENRSRWASHGFRFQQLEFSSQLANVQDAELYILKDVLQHWSSARVQDFLSRLRAAKASARFILVCNCAEPEDWPEMDIMDGGWRPLHATRPPLSNFDPEVLFRFPSLPNMKEVCLIHPLRHPQGRTGAVPRPMPLAVRGTASCCTRRATQPPPRRRTPQV